MPGVPPLHKCSSYDQVGVNSGSISSARQVGCPIVGLPSHAGHPLYQKFQATAPAVGTHVTTQEGDGRVVAHSVPKDAVVVRMDADGSRCSCSRASACGPRQAHEERYT